MEYKAQARFVRVSPQKARQVAATVKGKSVEQGINTLRFLPNKSAGLIGKVVASAMANAENNGGVDVDELVIKNVIIDQGPTMKRYRFRAQGRVSRILKRTSHITVILDTAGVS